MKSADSFNIPSLRRNKFALLLFVLLSANAFSQHGVDSLKEFLKTATGTPRAKALIELSASFPSNDTANIFPLTKEAFDISVKSGYKKGQVYYFYNRARFLAANGDRKAGFAFLKNCFQYLDSITPSKELGSYYINLGGIYSDGGEPEKASQTYLKALKICDEINDTNGIARASHGLGIVQQYVGNIDDAEKYYLKAIKYYEMGGETGKQATMTLNLGSLALNRAMLSKKEEDFSKSLEYLNKSLSIATRLKNYEIMGNCYNNIASLYGFKEEYDICLEYNFKALEIRKRLGGKYGIASSLANIGMVYYYKKRNDLAEKYLLESTDIAKAINSTKLMPSNYGMLSDIYYEQKKFEKSLEYYKRSASIKDSLNNAEKIRSMSELEKKYDTEKKDKEIEQLNHTQEVNDAEIARQRIVNYSVGIGLALVLLFSFFLLKANRERRKTNDQLNVQNTIIEEKNRSITDSINYAKTIQSAIIPSASEFSNAFADAFVLYMPKDIVSGDFYWISQSADQVIFAAVDCTGHGVPGGFMSMLSSSLLSEIVNEQKVNAPAEILNQLRDKIMSSLKQTGQTGESKDGMDISLCCLNKKTLELNYANAFNSFYLIDAEELKETEVNKMPVGYHHQMEPFKQSTLQLKKGNILYLFTDGYADQFGGKKEGGKKFKYSRLKTLLLSIQNKPMAEQRTILETTINEWRGDLEQVDDICVIGVKI